MKMNRDPLFKQDAEKYLREAKNGMSDEDSERKLIYNLRCKAVYLSNYDFDAFMQLIADNKEIFKYHFDREGKECIRRLVNDARSKHRCLTNEEKMMVDDTFGDYVASEDSEVIILGAVKQEPLNPKGYAFEKALRDNFNATYSKFWDWINSDNFKKQAYQRKDLYNLMYDLIQHQKLSNIYIGKRKHYEPEDEVYFSEVLRMME